MTDTKELLELINGIAIGWSIGAMMFGNTNEAIVLILVALVAGKLARVIK